MARGLGKGLGAMFGDAILEPEDKEITTLPLVKIEPRMDQPRKRFDEAAMEELVSSVREHGVIQPLTVRPVGGGYYQIIAGERRWRAAREANLDSVPVKIIEADDKTAMELALVENLQREDLNPIEEAMGYETLINEYGLTQEDAAARVGKSRPVVANMLRLLKLPESVRDLVESGKLSQSIARLVLELPGDEPRSIAAAEIAAKEMTVREAEAYIKRLQKAPSITPPSPEVDYIARLERNISSALGRRVKIMHGKKKGKIEIEYYGADDFEALCREIGINPISEE